MLLCTDSVMCRTTKEKSSEGEATSERSYECELLLLSLAKDRVDCFDG